MLPTGRGPQNLPHILLGYDQQQTQSRGIDDVEEHKTQLHLQKLSAFSQALMITVYSI